MQPYNYLYDNLPLRNILDRQEIINSEVDKNSLWIRESIGTQGTLANRLAQSINDDGSLKVEAVDATLHNISEHTDGAGYVRMTQDESDKLALVSDNATALMIQFNTASVEVTFDDELVEFSDSDTISWEVEAPNIVKAHMAFPPEAAHQHYYEVTPLTNGSYHDYKVTSLYTPFIEGSLRVYINGVRIFSDVSVYTPDATHTTWYLTYFTPSHLAGTFTLNRNITIADVIKIDFDTILV